MPEHAKRDEELRRELVELAGADQEFRHRWSSLDQEQVRAELLRDHERAARVGELVTTHGWPGASLVGEDGASAAWLLVQHADHDVALQERCLALLADAVAREEAEPWQLAYLTDRVRVNRGLEQVYGTQFHGHGETYAPRPIENPDQLDERRAAVGLEPFAEYEARMRELERRD